MPEQTALPTNASPGGHCSHQRGNSMYHSGCVRPKPSVIFTLAGSLFLIAGCEKTESVQSGQRGSAMIQFYKPSQLAKLQEINSIPEPEPNDPYDPSFPMATEVHQNVQVLTDLNALEFARLMNAISTWVSPEQGCSYCHNPGDLASDEKFTKIVSREMLKMTRSINTNWKSHVADTGVTCWTCHRGQPIPSDIWFKTPEPETPSAGISGWKGGQNVAGVSINGNSALPFDPYTPFFDEANQIAVQGTEVLPYGNRQSIKQAEWTYSLMMNMSQSLGVNCTYCHHTRAMGVWDQSTPQRVTAWHGIRMVRDLNAGYLNPLKPLYPKDRLGPEDDAPKTACATCHKGTYKPLFGQTMLDDYPSLAGVLPERLDPESEAAAVKALAQVSPEIAALTPVEPAASARAPAPATKQSTEQRLAEPDSTNDGDATADQTTTDPGSTTPNTASVTPLEGPATQVAPLLSSLSFWQTPRHLAKAEMGAENGIAASPEAAPAEPMAGSAGSSEASDADNPDSASAKPPEKTGANAPGSIEMAGGAETNVSQIEDTKRRVDALSARLDQERLALRQQLEVVREQRDQIASEVKAQLTDQHEDRLEEMEQSLQAANARLDQERTALQQQLQVVRKQRSEAHAAAEVKIDPKQHEAKLDAAETRIRAAGAKLEQQRHALQQQLRLVRGQRDTAQAQAEQQMRDLHGLHEEALGKKRQQIAALETRLEQNLVALNQQLAVARSQGNDADARLTALEQAHQTKLTELKQQIKETEARLTEDQDRLQQQLALAREERDALVLASKSKVSELEQLESEMAQAEADHAEALTEAQGSVTQRPLQPQDAEEIGGRLTEYGILVQLGSDELRFASGSASLPAQQIPTLERTAALLAARPELSARIEGHTDSIGSVNINQALSQQRAEAVRQALIARGIDPRRLAARGAGAAQPIADNGTREGRRQNRRVEIYLTADSEQAAVGDSSG